MSIYCRPFLKWAGSKFSLLKYILSELPQADRLIEPFVGSGVVFLNTNYPKSLLNDKNPYLIELYKQLKRHKYKFIEDARLLFTKSSNKENYYYKMRDEFNRQTDSYRRSLIFLYLNRHCYNGLCRFNKSGKFNVPFGRYKEPYFPELGLKKFLEKIDSAKFTCSDYKLVMDIAKKGDVVYCDPPYAPLSKTANFTNYAVGGFSIEDQEQLAARAEELSKRGICVVISNHDLPLTRSLYKKARIVSVKALRKIGQNVNSRGYVKELIAVFEK